MKKLILLLLIVSIFCFSLTLYTYPQNVVAKYIGVNKQLNGIACEFIKKLNEILKQYDIEIKFKDNVPKNLSQILSSLKSNEIQIFIGLAKSEDRSKNLKFTNYPLWSTQLGILSKSSNLEFTDKKFGIIKSTKTAEEVKKMIPQIVQKTYEDIEAAVNALLSDKVDYVIYNKGILSYYANLYNLRFLPLGTERYRQYIAFSKKVDDKIISIVDNALKEIFTSSVYKEIFERFPAFSPGNEVYFAIIQWPPYEYKENGVWKGIDYEIAKLAFQKLGFNLIIKEYPWTRCLELVKSKAFDGTMTLIITDERKEYMYYTSVPISYGVDVFFSLKNLPRQKIFLGYVNGYAYNEKVFKSGYKLMPVSSDYKGMELLSKQRIDVFVTNFCVGMFYAKKLGIDVEYSEPIAYFKYYLSFSRSFFGKYLSESISKIFKQFRKDGTYERIYEKYNLTFREDMLDE
ncbi:ABC transporter substrate-binding protein [Thermosipho melanesiensis]|uniref:Extracellular solute-binding protein, family 3 n=2 Tax=Thermosipho melanesiensis TaxID=46541 RepID=A6LKB5_THEM4|nr:transporter substrate-binding domain-containing protein [Thermosipho melanesiensis]ABR30366.1 extracellular solute-binding protein, family 3 [Thermosipho melanesiensis BI429]APT73531.1 ABC transporter substrate-binding protein [Thermosipho melanesiensis]OOC37481.1 ABC transporter substrate-binding protein [Thermosipho melanesiensis]OOC39620.1 ABC transporter substrate-binding protein [Thermosipho melanesiensis]OOC39638.1 ABC transporter substrate-binding protein [Thermosipho melanesiensis]